MRPSKITRIVKIMTALQSGRRLTADDLAEMFDVSRRTIFRDLNELQAIGVPFEYDINSKGYEVKPEFFLRPLELNLQQALSLLLLIRESSKHMQLPYMSSVLMAALKIESNLPREIMKYCEGTTKFISSKPHPQAPTKELDRVFELLQRAIERKHKTKMSYDSFFDKQVIKTEFWPFHLLYNRRAWYVVGFSKMHDSVRTFKLGRIKEIDAIDKCYISKKGFDAGNYFGQTWSMIPEGKVYNIKLRFKSKVAKNVSEVHWHSSQKITFEKGGSAIAEFRVDGLGEITWWILGYGDQVEVLQPAALRKKIKKTAENIVKINSQSK